MMCRPPLDFITRKGRREVLMQGKFDGQTLSEIVAEMITEGVTGALRVRRERAQAVIYADAGAVVEAATNLRTTRLSACLKRWQLLDQPGDAWLINPNAEIEKLSDDDLAARLVREHRFNMHDIAGLRARQVRDTLRLILTWTTGDWIFDGRARLNTAAAIDVTAVLIEAARRTPPHIVAAMFDDDTILIEPVATDNLTSRSASPDTTSLNPSMLDTQTAEATLTPLEAFVLSRVETPLRVADLTAMCGTPAAELQARLYVLACAGLIKPQRAPRFLVKNETTAMPNAAEFFKPPTASETTSAPDIKPASTDATTVEETDTQRRHALLARGHADNHYLALGVNRSANAAAVKATYHALAKRFHPDTFRGITDDERAAVESAFARLTRAYETLRDEQARLAYDRQLDMNAAPANVTATPSPLIPRAPVAADTTLSTVASNLPRQAFPEHIFNEGINALKGGNHMLAHVKLSEAASREPHNAKYRAHFGTLLARDARTRRTAEAELRAAVQLEPRTVEYRIMLAELYRDMGFPLRAVGELERAIETLPAEAARLKRLLAEMKRAKN